MKFKIILIGLLLLPIFAVSNSFAQDMEVIYYHNDTLGSPRAATDENGDVLWRENYAPYGKKLDNQQEGSGNHIGYTGKPHEKITGFTYLNARYYDPVIGRFMAVDPVEFTSLGVPHFQRYSYAYNNPYRYTDPDGEFGQVVGAITGLALEAAIQGASGKLDVSGLVSAAALGAVGLGLVSKAKNLGKIAKELVDTGVEAAKSGLEAGVKGEENIAGKMAEDVMSSKLGSKIGDLAKSKLSTKVLDKAKQVNTPEGVKSKLNNAKKKRQKAMDMAKVDAEMAGSVGGAAADKAASTGAKETIGSVKSGDDEE